MAGSTLLAPTTEQQRPGVAELDSSASDELARARAIVDAYGDDSLSPFLLRPDKSFTFAAGGVLAYRMLGRTAVVSSDPVGPAEAIAATVTQLREKVLRDGGRVTLYGCSAHHLAVYRELGLRAICAGEEAVVDPASFGLQGRAVRKLRQSVNRMHRRGWELQAREGHQIPPDLEAEIAALERRWRSESGRMLGFAMAMGAIDPGIAPADLYLLARSPAGDLAGVMHFIAHRGKLSLDTMRRVGETPNGLNEALVCTALEVARERGVPEVSLNYAGLAHLIRSPADSRLGELLRGPALRLLGRRFQMQRLVNFNEKFSPEWRPRYLVYESRAALPGSIVRILQAEGFLR